MENKININYIDIASISTNNTNPRKAWTELLQAIDNIYVNFKKSHINPKELNILLMEEANNSNGVPDIGSIDKIIETMDRYVTEYKIPEVTSLFLDFKRIAAIYLFSIGSQRKINGITKSNY